MRFSSLVMSMNKTFSKSYIISPLDLILHNLVLNARCYLFYLCREKFHQSCQLVWQKLTAPNSTAQLSQCEKCVNIHWGENSLKLDYTAEFLSRNPSGESKTISKDPISLIHIKRGQLINGTTKFIIFWLRTRLYVGRSVGERNAIPNITQTVEHGGNSSIMWWGILPIESQGFTPGEGFIKSDKLSQPTAPSGTRFVA